MEWSGLVVGSEGVDCEEDWFEVAILDMIGSVDVDKNFVEGLIIELLFDVGNSAAGSGDAVFEEEDVVAEAFDFVHVVGNENNGSSLPVEIFDDVHEEFAIDGVETLGGLVEDEEFGVLHDGDAELDFLLLTGGEFFEFGSGLVL